MDKLIPVPNVIGISAPQAAALLAAAGLTNSQLPPETAQQPSLVTSQSPAVGAEVPLETKVHLTIAP